jgi:hypothetical protein
VPDRAIRFAPASRSEKSAIQPSYAHDLRGLSRPDREPRDPSRLLFLRKSRPCDGTFFVSETVNLVKVPEDGFGSSIF